MFNALVYVQDVRRKFPEYEIYNKKVFKFAQPVEGGEKQYAITIHFTNHLPNDWIVGKTGFGNKVYNLKCTRDHLRAVHGLLL